MAWLQAHRGWWALTLLLAVWLAGCGERGPSLPRLGPDDTVLAFGDSLTHGTGASPETAYPAQLERLIRHRVINAGVPGETTAAGLERLPEALATHRPRLLLLCLGGNDILHRVEAAQTVENLRAMLRLAKAQGVDVVLIGVPDLQLFGGAPAFYAQLAEEFHVPYEGEVFNEVLKTRGLKSDAVHANGEGYRRVAERLAELLADTGAI